MAASSNIHAAVHLSQINNESVEWMCQGDYQAAFYHLQDAIRQVSGILSRPTTDKDAKSKPPRQESLVEAHPGYMVAQNCEGSGTGSADHKLLSCNILCLPFFISKLCCQHESDNAANDYSSIQTVASVAIFNMGMALCLQSNHAATCRARDRLLDRAFFLYKQALQLTDESSQIYLASCHNMVEISVHRGDLVEAQKWRYRIIQATNVIGESWGIYQQAVCIYHSGAFTASRAA